MARLNDNFGFILKVLTGKMKLFCLFDEGFLVLGSHMLSFS